VILTEIIAPYRIPVFNALAQLDEIDLHVIFLAETDPALRKWRVYKEEINFSYEVLPSYRARWRDHAALINRGVGSALRKASPDVILCGGYNYFASWEALFWARRNRVTFLLWTESNAKDLRANNWLTDSLKRIFLNGCDSFVVPGKSSREYLEGFCVAAERIFTAPNAVDIDLFSKAAEAVRANAARCRQDYKLPSRFFLFVGRLTSEKGVFDLLHAYCKLDPELRAGIGLVFVGDGPARAELQRRANNLAPGLVRFPGFAHREQLAGYYALAQGFVLPTRTDTWGLAVNEAMACSLPIICSDVAGCVADLVEEGWNGHVIPPLEIDRLTWALEDMSSDGEKIRVMGENSRKRIMRFSPRQCAEGIANAALSRKPKYA
jgi:glycosyltransferase involved in cell wall biosynthesis